MSTKIALQELSTRFDNFEEQFGKMGDDVSTIAALFYNYFDNSAYVTGWQPTSVEGWYLDEITELVNKNVRAWNSTIETEEVQ